jgi:hypothetical protein
VASIDELLPKRDSERSVPICSYCVSQQRCGHAQERNVEKSVMSLTSNVNGFLSVSESVSEKCKAIAAKHGEDPDSLDLTDGKQLGVHLLMQKEAEPIRQYLRGLSVEALQELAALMYAGRDGTEFHQCLAETRSRSDSPEELVESITAKHVACRGYFEKGLAALGE